MIGTTATMTLTRGDKILIGCLIALNAALFLRWTAPAKPGDWVVIEVDKNERARHSLRQEKTVRVEGPLGVTEVEIREGKARILRSPCSGKLCIKSGFIQYADRLAACLPNRVVVRIEGGGHRGVDAVVG